MENERIDYSSIIKECVPVRDAVEMYLNTPIRQNRIPCPFHGGTDYNMGIKPKYFHCFVCGIGGDVIDFTRKLFHLSWFDAVCKLNDDFHLDLPVRGPMTDKIKQSIADRKRRYTDSIIEDLKQYQVQLEYESMCEMLKIVEQICKESAPAPWDDEWDSVWCQAMRLRTELKEEIEMVDLERIAMEEERKEKEGRRV